MYYSGIIGAGEELWGTDHCKAPHTVFMARIGGAYLGMWRGLSDNLISIYKDSYLKIIQKA